MTNKIEQVQDVGNQAIDLLLWKSNRLKTLAKVKPSSNTPELLAKADNYEKIADSVRERILRCAPGDEDRILRKFENYLLHNQKDALSAKAYRENVDELQEQVEVLLDKAKEFEQLSTISDPTSKNYDLLTKDCLRVSGTLQGMLEKGLLGNPQSLLDQTQSFITRVTLRHEELQRRRIKNEALQKSQAELNKHLEPVLLKATEFETLADQVPHLSEEYQALAKESRREVESLQERLITQGPEFLDQIIFYAKTFFESIENRAESLQQQEEDEQVSKGLRAEITETISLLKNQAREIELDAVKSIKSSEPLELLALDCRRIAEQAGTVLKTGHQAELEAQRQQTSIFLQEVKARHLALLEKEIEYTLAPEPQKTALVTRILNKTSRWIYKFIRGFFRKGMILAMVIIMLGIFLIFIQAAMNSDQGLPNPANIVEWIFSGDMYSRNE